MKAKKSLGQNFLIDSNVINQIVGNVLATKDDLVIEIGPGRGALTKELQKKDCNIIAYELDLDLEPILKKIENNKTKIIFKDFLQADIKSDIKDIKYKDLYIVGNLPYYITTPIIKKIIDSNLNFKSFTIMVQKEVADRFMAKSKTKEYGYITLVLKYYYNIMKVTDVSKYAFDPVPKVESTVISFTKRKDVPNIDATKYFKFLEKAFQFKRKNLKNNLVGYDFAKVREILVKNKFSETARAEELSEEILIEIYKALN